MFVEREAIASCKDILKLKGCPAWIIGIVEKDRRTARIIEMPCVIEVLSKETPEDYDTLLSYYQSIKSFSQLWISELSTLSKYKFPKVNHFHAYFVRKFMLLNNEQPHGNKD